jgi:hypothetical protein
MKTPTTEWPAAKVVSRPSVSPGRSERAPDAVSVKIRSQPASLSASSWRLGFCAVLESRA